MSALFNYEVDRDTRVQCLGLVERALARLRRGEEIFLAEQRAGAKDRPVWKRKQVHAPFTRMTADEKAQMLKLWNEGRSISEVARIIKRQPSTVRWHLKYAPREKLTRKF